MPIGASKEKTAPRKMVPRRPSQSFRGSLTHAKLFRLKPGISESPGISHEEALWE